jgi:hypothetical protein
VTVTEVLQANDPAAIAVVQAIRGGDLDGLRGLLESHPGLATAGIADGCPGGMTRSLLHIATDWPGNFPAVGATIATLISAGTDPNVRPPFGPHGETPLHWAASCDDVEALDALLDAGADLEADGAVIAGGTALADAVAFGQWRAARRLVERGAAVNLWQAAALGMVDRVRADLAAQPPPVGDEVSNAFWLACHGGQRATAELLLEHGADLREVRYDGLTPLGAARRSGADELAAWLASRGG